MLSEERIEKFRKMFKKDYGKKLTKIEVSEAAYNLLGFFDLLLKIDIRVNPQRYRSKKKVY